MPSFLAALRIFSAEPLSTLTPTTVSPLALYFSCNSASLGTVSLQVLHQVAQKSTINGLPAKSALFQTLPSSSGSENEGISLAAGFASLPAEAAGAAGVSGVPDSSAAKTSPSIDPK